MEKYSQDDPIYKNEKENLDMNLVLDKIILQNPTNEQIYANHSNYAQNCENYDDNANYFMETQPTNNFYQKSKQQQTIKFIKPILDISLFNGEYGIPLKNRILEAKITARCYLLSQSSSVRTLIEDSKGNAIRLQIYNYITKENIKQLSEKLPKGRKIIIQNPCYKRFNDGYPGIRVDNPYELIFDKNIDDVLKDLGSINSIQQQKESAKQLKDNGNKFYGNQQYQQAIDCYNEAIQLIIGQEHYPNEDFVPFLEIPNNYLQKTDILQDCEELCTNLFNNLSLCYLSQQRYLPSALYSKCALKIDNLNVKAIYRLTTSLQKLGAINYSIEILQNFLGKITNQKKTSDNAAQQNSNDKDINDLQDQLQQMQQQEKKINEDKHILSILKNQVINYTNYLGKVRLIWQKNKGISVIANEDLQIGSLILIEKPILKCKLADKSDFKLYYDLIKILAQDNQKSKYILDQLRCMYPRMNDQLKLNRDINADNFVIPKTENEGKQCGLSLSDLSHIERVVCRNQFLIVDDTKFVLNYTHENSLFFLASLFNHSCIPNANQSYIQDHMIIRTIKNVKKGEEITITYISTQDQSLQERKYNLLTSYGFLCQCQMCNNILENEDIWIKNFDKISLVCPIKQNHILYPENINLKFCSFKCLEKNCKGKLSIQEAIKINQEMDQQIESIMLKLTDQSQSNIQQLYYKCEQFEQQILKKLGQRHTLILKFYTIFCLVLCKYLNIQKKIEITEKLIDLYKFYDLNLKMINQLIMEIANQTQSDKQYFKKTIQFYKQLYENHKIYVGGGIDEFNYRLQLSNINLEKGFFKEFL